MSETETIPGFENKVLIDPQRLRQLEDVYKERLTENLPLAKAARIAAKQEAILMSDQIPPGVKKALATPPTKRNCGPKRSDNLLGLDRMLMTNAMPKPMPMRKAPYTPC